MKVVAKRKAPRTKLYPEHLEDLRKSGLSDETIKEAKILTINIREMFTKLGFEIPGVESAYSILYPGSDFVRYKIFYADTTNRKKPKYLQRKGSGNRLYIPHQARKVLSNPSIDLYITEGEKKALKACQENLPCIGLSGLWNWSDGHKRLLKDFDLITLKGRVVYIVPDSDWRDPNKHGYAKNLVQAVYSLAYKLKERGAKVFIVNLSEKEKAK